MNQTERNGKEILEYRIYTLIGTLLCIILVPILAINLTLIVKSWTSKEKVPTFAGVFPMVVLTDSMKGVINSGDLIICHTADATEIKEGDIISFFDPDGNGQSIVTHRVIQINEIDGKLSFVTRGDANNTKDRIPVPAENLVGVYKTRIPGAGHIAMFAQTTPGLLVCVVLPLALFIGIDILKRRKYERKNKQDTGALLAELEALKQEKALAEAERATSIPDDVAGGIAPGGCQ